MDIINEATRPGVLKFPQALSVWHDKVSGKIAELNFDGI